MFINIKSVKIKYCFHVSEKNSVSNDNNNNNNGFVDRSIP